MWIDNEGGGLLGDLAKHRMTSRFLAVVVALVGIVLVATTRASVQSLGQHNNWGLDRINQRALSLDESLHDAADGTGVNIYIIDTGVRRTHIDFRDAHGNSRVTYVGDFCTGTLRTSSKELDTGDGYDGHGTHNASYAAGHMSGVAKNAKIFSLRASWQAPTTDPDDAANGGTACGDQTNGRANDQAVMQAVNWITHHGQKPAVVNLSFGAGSPQTQNAILGSIAAGFLYTLSGDTGGLVSDHWGTQVPTQALVVGGTDMNDIPLGAGYGPLLALFAPAQHLFGAGKASDDDYSIPEFDGCSQTCRGGDSFAAPFVAGVAATYLHLHPDATPAQVRQAMISAATPGVVKTDASGEPNLLLRSLYRIAPSSGTGGKLNMITVRYLPSVDATGRARAAGTRIAQCPPNCPLVGTPWGLGQIDETFQVAWQNFPLEVLRDPVRKAEALSRLFGLAVPRRV